MTNEKVRESLVNQISGSWATCTPIARPNYEFEPPSADSVDSNYTQPSCFIKYYIRIGNAATKEIRGVGLRYGVLMIEINQPLSTGTKIGNQLTDRMEAAFRLKDLNGVQIGEPYTIDIGELHEKHQSANRSFYRFMVNIPFSCWIGE
jgi:hypothetical protein